MQLFQYSYIVKSLRRHLLGANEEVRAQHALSPAGQPLLLPSLQHKGDASSEQGALQGHLDGDSMHCYVWAGGVGWGWHPLQQGLICPTTCIAPHCLAFATTLAGLYLAGTTHFQQQWSKSSIWQVWLFSKAGCLALMLCSPKHHDPDSIASATAMLHKRLLTKKGQIA